MNKKARPDDLLMENSATSVRQRSATGNAEAGSTVALKWGGLCEVLAKSVHQTKFVYSLLIPATHRPTRKSLSNFSLQVQTCREHSVTPWLTPLQCSSNSNREDTYK